MTSNGTGCGDGTTVTSHRPVKKTQMDTMRVFIRWCEAIDTVNPDLSTKVTSPTLSESQAVRDAMVETDDAETILEYLCRYEYASGRHVCFRLLWRAGLRRGALVALDVEDYDAEARSLEVVHRPESGTPIKNGEYSERFIALTEAICEVLDAWLADRRPDVTDEEGRNPLVLLDKGVHTRQQSRPTCTRQRGRVFTPTTVRTAARLRRAMQQLTEQKRGTAHPLSPHTVRRGAITHWLTADVPEPVVSD